MWSNLAVASSQVESSHQSLQPAEMTATSSLTTPRYIMISVSYLSPAPISCLTSKTMRSPTIFPRKDRQIFEWVYFDKKRSTQYDETVVGRKLMWTSNTGLPVFIRCCRRGKQGEREVNGDKPAVFMPPRTQTNQRIVLMLMLMENLKITILNFLSI